MQPQPPPVERLGDLCWLLAHDERGQRRLGPHHFAIALAASVLGEALTQSSAHVTDSADVVADPVIAHVLGELTGAAREGLVRPAQVWVEWLASREHESTEHYVVSRMVAAGHLVYQRRRLAAATGLVAFAPVTALIAAVDSERPVDGVHPLDGVRAASDPIRLLGGIANACGLAPLVSVSGQDMVRPLQLLAMKLSTPLYSLVTATEEAIHAAATRRR